MTRPTSNSFTAYFLALVCLALFCSSLESACGKVQRSDTLRASLVAVNVARDGFQVWDLAHQRLLVEDAKTREEARAAVDTYRTTVQRPIVDGFEVAYRALALAAIQSDDPSLRSALAEASTILSAVERLLKSSGVEKEGGK